MTLLLWVRILGDLAFYYAFAGFFVSVNGSAFCLPGILIPSFLCALSVRGDRPALRVGITLISAVCLVLPGIGMADRIAFLPAYAYVIYLARTGRCSLSCDRQKDLLKRFCVSYPLFFLMCCMFGGFSLLCRYSLPSAVIMLAAGVYLLQTLRHEPEIYLQRTYLIRSLVPPFLLAAAAWLLQLNVVAQAVTAACSALYRTVLLPVLSAVSYAVIGLFTVVFSPVVFLLSLLTLSTGSTEETELVETEEMDLASGTGIGIPIWVRVLLMLAIAAALIALCVLLIRLLRRLAGGKVQGKIGGMASEEVRGGAEHPGKVPGAAANFSPLHPVSRIRRRYRQYLRLCRDKGSALLESDTSADVLSRTAGLFPDPEDCSRLREIYIRARYGADASQEDDAAAKEILEKLRKGK